MVPPVQHPQIVPFTLLTYDEHIIDSKPMNLTYKVDSMIHSVYPNTSDINGGIQFTLAGNFGILSFEDPPDFILFWDN